MSLDNLQDRVSAHRLSDDLWDLVRIPSPTGRERKAALRYAAMLAEAGAEVEVDHSIADSPVVIGRLQGGGVGKTLQLAGHIDHIDVPHPEPERTPERISGRGAADMKSGLAAMLEVVRVFANSRESFVGNILVTAYGLHEAPLGHSEGIRGLIKRGIHGDAALVFEGPPDSAVVCGKGQSIWSLVIRRDGEACHELRRPAGADDLLRAAQDLGQRLLAENTRLCTAEATHTLLGPESVFIGQFHYGDFYNRAPVSCSLQGTWRWLPEKSFADIQRALHAVVASVDIPTGISVEQDWTFVGESFSLDPDERIVRALRCAYEELNGRSMKLAGVSGVLDTNRLVPIGHIPTVSLDCHGETAHGDREVVQISSMVAGCRLAVATAAHYLASASSDGSAQGKKAR